MSNRRPPYIYIIPSGSYLNPSANTNTTTTSVLSASLDVVILAGQSNMVGWVPTTGQINPKIDYSDPRILQHSAFATFQNQLVLASEPLNHSDGRENPVGLGMSFARKYIQNNPASTLILLPHGHGGTGFSDNNWRVGDIRTNALIANANLVKSKYPNANFKAILWHQGEKEVQNDVSREQYIAWLTAFVAHLRSSINGAENTPFIAGEISRQWITSEGATGTRIQQVIRDIPTFINRSAVASSEGLTVHDGIHFNTNSNRQLGLRYYDKYLEALNHSLTPTVLSIPITLSATPSTNSASLNWVQNGTVADSWILEYKLQSSSVWQSVNVSSRPYNLTGLTAQTGYNFRVKAVKNQTQSIFSTVFNFTTIAEEVVDTPPVLVVPSGVPTPSFRYTFANNDYSDSSGNNNHGTFVPMQDGLAGIITDTTRGKVFSTNINGYILTPISLTPSYSKMLWVRLDAHLPNGNLISSTVGERHAWWFPFPDIQAGHGNGQSLNNTSNFVPDNLVWYHLALTFDNATQALTFYTNGQIQRQLTINTYAGQASTDKTYIAMYNPSNNNGLRGRVQNCMVWNTALTAANVQSIYNAENI